MSKVRVGQVAVSTPFDNTSNGFTSEEVQSAIEEVDGKVTGKPRAIVTFGYQGNANTGRWLETFDSVSSNQVPFVTAEPAKIVALSLVNKNTNTGTVSLYKNGILVYTISLVNDTYVTIKDLSISMIEGDQLNAQVTAGTLSAPLLYTSIQINL